MSLLKVRTWAIVAVLVALQAPVMFAVNGSTPTKKARVDQQIEQIEQSGETSGTLGVIVRPDGTSDWASVVKALQSKAKVGTQAKKSNAISLKISLSDLAWLESLPGIGSVSVDARIRSASLGTSPPVGGPGNTTTTVLTPNVLRTQLALTDADPKGDGIGIAIVDSGIAPVVDLADHITAFYDFTNGQPGVATAPVDGYGHGTHVAGLAAGSGGLSNGEYGGVAPHARLIGLRVLDNSGSGSTSDVIAAIEFATANKVALGIDVMNLSLGHPPFESAETDPLVQAVEAASRAGIVVVVSAGNAGVNPQTNQVGYAGILSPGNAPSALTIASAKTQNTVDPGDDLIANYSSRGPTWIDGFAKPDFAVPGQNVLAPAAPGSFLVTAYPSLVVDNNYLKLSGTSMAAGVESGLVAVVIEASRGTAASIHGTAGTQLTGHAIKAFMEYTAFTMHDANGNVYDRLSQGAGRVNGQGVLSLARSVDPNAPAGSPWIIAPVVPYSTYNSVSIPWAQNIVWGDNIVWGENILWGDSVDKRADTHGKKMAK
jgi:subtilisin family serine protease